MIRILIADDHPLVRKGIIKIISDYDDVELVAEAADCTETMEILSKISVDLLILDISMPQQSGLEILPSIRRLYPNIPVLILSMHSEPQYAFRALKDGACGYLLKDSSADLLIQAIHKVSKGEKYIDPKLAEKMIWAIEDLDSSKQKLSRRESEVLNLICEGKAQKQIASIMCVSVKTVSTYRSRIMQKLHLSNTVDLVKYCLKHAEINKSKIL